MMSKEDMRKEGIKSPDLIDAMSFAFLENCHYVPSDTGTELHGKAKAQMVDQLKAELEAAMGDDVITAI